jgi:lipase chaperone LimK
VKQGRVAAIGLAAAAIAVGVWWAVDPFASAPQVVDAAASPVAGPSQTDPAAASYAAAIAARAQPAPAASQPDTLLTRGLHSRIEDLLLEAGQAATPAELKARAGALVQRYFDAQDVARAVLLLNRYIDYRVALGNVAAPKPGDPDALRTAIDSRRAIAERYFSPEEFTALFSGQEELDRLTVRRFEIARDATLSPEARIAAIRTAEARLAPELQAWRADTQAHDAVARQTAAFDAAGLDDHARYVARSKAHGDAAAQRLAQLDAEERNWHARLDRYAAQQSGGAREAQLAELKRQLFSAEEQVRVEAALVLRRAK